MGAQHSIDPNTCDRLAASAMTEIKHVGFSSSVPVA
jgi:hypothetical protein